MKTIGIDARFYGEAGPGRYVKNILSGLEKADSTNKYIVFMRTKGFDQYNPVNSKFIKVLADYKWYTWGEQVGFLIKLLSYKLDLFYVPHFNFPILYPGKLVTAIPDLIMHTFSTERGTTLPRPYFKFKKLMYRFVVLAAVIRSIKIIVPSVDVLNDFLRVFTFTKKSKYIVATEGVDPLFLATANSNKTYTNLHERPYLLYISSMYEHKNVPRFLKAFKLLRDKYSQDVDLILIGKKDKYSLDIEQQVSNLNLQEFVFIPGNKAPVSDEETIAYRKFATLYVFPSLKEGFSLTPMEAQCLGLPCVISNIPVHKEIYEDSVSYFDPEDPEDIAAQINEVLQNENLRNLLIEKGYQQYKKYSWDLTAKLTLDTFNSIK